MKRGKFMKNELLENVLAEPGTDYGRLRNELANLCDKLDRCNSILQSLDADVLWSIRRIQPDETPPDIKYCRAWAVETLKRARYANEKFDDFHASEFNSIADRNDALTQASRDECDGWDYMCRRYLLLAYQYVLSRFSQEIAAYIELVDAVDVWNKQHVIQYVFEVPINDYKAPDLWKGFNLMPFVGRGFADG